MTPAEASQVLSWPHLFVHCWVTTCKVWSAFQDHFLRCHVSSTRELFVSQLQDDIKLHGSLGLPPHQGSGSGAGA